MPASALSIKLASLSNRALLGNGFFGEALYAGNRVVSAVGLKPPDGRSKVRPPKVLHAVRIGATNLREWPRPRPARDIVMRRSGSVPMNCRGNRGRFSGAAAAPHVLQFGVT